MSRDPASEGRVSIRTLDQLALWSSLSIVVALSWWYLFLLAQDMADMAGMPMGDMAGMHPWTALDFLLMFLMWAVMMVGMMVPTAVRAIYIYARVASQAQARGSPVAATQIFVAGYVLVWAAFSLGATALQAALDALGLLSPAMRSSSPLLGAGLLVAAGVYQLTPWKDTCLRHCQSPAAYLAGRFGPRALDALSLGIRHGLYCLGCCWVLMLLLFLGGVMNLLWIAAIAAFVLLEKVLPPALRVSRLAAVMMIASGAAYLMIA
ncbi:MAG TPA: DUF2182 domain-containing protein [Pseudomonadales bacterium]